MSQSSSKGCVEYKFLKTKLPRALHSIDSPMDGSICPQLSATTMENRVST